MNNELVLLLLCPAGVPYRRPNLNSSDSWLTRYESLVAWMRAHNGAWPRERNRLGRMSSMSAEDAEEHRLAQWVRKQRTRGPACLLVEVEAREGLSRSELLERLEGWEWKGVSERHRGGGKEMVEGVRTRE